MAMIVPQNIVEQGALERFAELHWLDIVIGFVFRLIARLAEPFLAFGLIASAIDYGSHGSFLAGNAYLMAAWVATQALALEGSGGSVLAMSFEAGSEGDHVKAWIQRVLAIALMAVGGIMFFAEMAAPVPGFKVIIASGGYVYTMAALRSVVSLGFLAVCRTRKHRYSGTAQIAQSAQREEHFESQIAEMRSDLDETAHQIEDVHSEVAELRKTIHEQLCALRDGMRSQLSEIPAMIQSQTYEVDPAQLSAQIDAHLEEAMMRTVQSIQAELAQVVNGLRSDLDVHVAHVVDQAMRTAQSKSVAQPPKTTDELAQRQNGKTAHSKETVKIPATGESAQLRIQRYVAAQRAQGCEPTIAQIMDVTGCAKNTVVRYRREVEVAQ